MISIDGYKFWPCLFFFYSTYFLFIFPFINEIFQKDFPDSEEEKNFIISKSFCFQGCISFAK